MAETLRAVSQGLRDTVRKPTESALFSDYGRMCLVVDEVINEVPLVPTHCRSSGCFQGLLRCMQILQGILESNDREAIQRGLKMKVGCIHKSGMHDIVWSEIKAVM